MPISARRAHGLSSVAVERRALPPRPRPYTSAQARVAGVAGVAAVERALSPRPLADDVGRILAGRTTFPRQLWGEVI